MLTVKIKKEKEEQKERKRFVFSFFSLTVIKKFNQITITPRQRRKKLDEKNRKCTVLPK